MSRHNRASAIASGLRGALARTKSASTSCPAAPGAGRVTLGASTGVPFLAIGEAGVGVSRGLTLGAIAGITPTVVGFGVRPRAVLYSGARARVFVNAPILYYPATHLSGGEPWFL